MISPASGLAAMVARGVLPAAEASSFVPRHAARSLVALAEGILALEAE